MAFILFYCTEMVYLIENYKTASFIFWGLQCSQGKELETGQANCLLSALPLLQELKDKLSELKKLCRNLFFRVEERRKWPERLAALESLLNHSNIFLK